MAARRLLQQQLRLLAQRSAPGSPSKLPHLAQATELAALPAMEGASQNRQPLWHTLSLGFAVAGVATLAPSSTAHCAGVTGEHVSTLPNLADAGMTLKGSVTPTQQRSIVFVLGGPGSGKGTQCAKLVEEFGIVHLSAGDLLRAHMKSGSPDGNMVAEMIKNGQIVPSHVKVLQPQTQAYGVKDICGVQVTNGLLERAMTQSGKDRFLIDGFPRNEENRAAFEADTGEEPTFVLYFDCPESVMEARLLGRNEGRTDDNIETIKKRFQVFLQSSLPVIQHYEAKGKVHRIYADRSPDEVYQEVRKLFL